mmetsp:Transcript_20938/g.60445  ORF Transcript_20938/g.60445 Transcript_20938/m.60445 type:complete len:161 (-) Transcript_20938:109-591(-)|eukprot:CAMPEP_0176122060 /NCGR_PEP_ID=MMETSP0120_2-20121206/61463_1 /TAXON_ID=160619 /ORGANISM="Kryptoperidinium foliaceum, Strain CCMP 1326" /LENGTH=160 /DNA_ID=CAMNT_0017456659 /DNA_START=76 /DNA_END=558 /DNA_ORIENTATION=+
MWRPDPGPCVAQVAEWGEHPDDVEYMRQLKAMPKRIMKRRELIVKNVDLEKVSKKQGKVNFSIACWALSEYSKSSGLGDEAASILHVFYESKDERKVLNAFSAAGVELEAAEAVPVEPDSSLPHEQEIMYSREALFIQDDFVYEEGPPLSTEELKKRFRM